MELVSADFTFVNEFIFRDPAKIMKIVRAFRIHTFVNTEEFTVFLGNQGITTVRAGKPERCGNNVTGGESLTAYFTLVLSIATIIVVDEMVRSSTEGTDGILRDSFSVSALNRFYCFSVLPFIVFEKELPVLFDKRFHDRKLIDFKSLVFRRVGIIKSPLLKMDISANKI